MGPILGAKKLYSAAAMAITMNTPINVIIGQIMINDIDAAVPKACKVEIAAVAFCGRTDMIDPIKAVPIMAFMIPAIRIMIAEINDMFNENGRIGIDLISFFSPIFFHPFFYSN